MLNDRTLFISSSKVEAEATQSIAASGTPLTLAATLKFAKNMDRNLYHSITTPLVVGIWFYLAVSGIRATSR